MLFFDIGTTIGYALSPVMNKSLHAALVKICTSGGGPLFHSSYDGVIARKMLSTQSIFHQPEQMEVWYGAWRRVARERLSSSLA